MCCWARRRVGTSVDPLSDNNLDTIEADFVVCDVHMVDLSAGVLLRDDSRVAGEL